MADSTATAAAPSTSTTDSAGSSISSSTSTSTPSTSPSPSDLPLCSTPNCGQPATLACPTCLSLSLPPSRFCSQSCFKSSWKAHNAEIHKPAKARLDFTPPAFDYTGPLRPHYVTPMRTVPDHIEKPEYADSGIPFTEMKLRQSTAIHINSAAEIRGIREANRLGRLVLDFAHSLVKVGITTEDIDRLVHLKCVELNCYPSPLNYHSFPKSCCTSVNEIICHGIPDARPLQDGDIINIDISVYHKGFHGDLNETYAVGTVDTEGKNLIKVTYDAMMLAIAHVKPGMFCRDFGDLISRHCNKHRLSVVKTYCGHGIGRLFHSAPNIPHYARNKAVGVLKPGMVFTIEPMVNIGTWKDVTWKDEWTSATADGKRSAQFEHCFTEVDTRVLTSRGLLFLDEILAADEGLLFACYDKDTQTLCYRRGDLVILDREPSQLFEFSSSGEAERWAEGSGPYAVNNDGDGDDEDGDDTRSCHVSLRVTGGHMMFGQLGQARKKGKMGSIVLEATPLAGQPPVTVPPALRSASSLLSPCEPCVKGTTRCKNRRKRRSCPVGCPPGQLCAHRRTIFRMVACAASGLMPLPDSGDRRRQTQRRLQLNDEQFLAFLELFGFWLGEGHISYTQPGSEYSAVVFREKKRDDRDFLHRIIPLCGLADDEWKVYGRYVYILAHRWFVWFDEEFGCKYSRSRFFDPQDPRVECYAASVDRSVKCCRRSDSLSSREDDMGEGHLEMGDEGGHGNWEEGEEERGDVEMGDDVYSDEPIGSDEDADPDLPAGPNVPIKSVKWFPEWILLNLIPAELLLVVRGLWRADGVWQRTGEGRGVQRISTSGPRFRDALVQALLHCGFSAYAHLTYRAGSIHGYTVDGKRMRVAQAKALGKTDHPFRARVDGWAVVWAGPTTSSDKGACWPNLLRQEGIRVQRYNPRDGRIWCVTVDHPHSLIVAQRAERHHGVVTKQSRPIITGNSVLVTDTGVEVLTARTKDSLPLWWEEGEAEEKKAEGVRGTGETEHKVNGDERKR